MAEWISPKKRKAIYERDRYCCRYCGKKLVFGQLSLDHIVARSKGGKHSEDNLVTACPQCQWKKMNRSLEEAGMTLLPIKAGD